MFDVPMVDILVEPNVQKFGMCSASKNQFILNQITVILHQNYYIFTREL